MIVHEITTNAPNGSMLLRPGCAGARLGIGLSSRTCARAVPRARGAAELVLGKIEMRCSKFFIRLLGRTATGEFAS